MEHHGIDSFGDLKSAGNAGVNNQYVGSNGAGVQWTWKTILPPSYLFTDKVSQAFVLASGDLSWNPPSGDAVQGVIYNAPGTFTLEANRLYELWATVVPTLAALGYSVQWVNAANTPIGSINQPTAVVAGLAHSHAIAVFKPLVATIVKVRLTAAVTVTFGPTSQVAIRSVDQ